MEEVFDTATVKTILDLVRMGYLYELKGVISAGKEARVYWGVSPKGEDLAVKIYFTATAEFRKGILKYIIGDPRFDKYVPRSTRKLMTLWARKEFKNYRLLHSAGVSVPRPIVQRDNVVIMEFIGESGRRAPLLREAELSTKEYEYIFKKVIEDVRKAYRIARLVHGDLSEYNIMVWKGRHYIIDVSQAVKTSHPHALALLVRDLRNLCRYFGEEVGIVVPRLEDLFRYITEEELRPGLAVFP